MQSPRVIMERAIDNTAKALASLGNKDQGSSRGFQNLIKLIGEAKTKHVSIATSSVNYFQFVLLLNLQ